MSFKQKIKQIEPNPLIEGILPSSPYVVFDFSEANKDLMALDMNNQQAFEQYIRKELQKKNVLFGIGKYAENRILYRRFNLFETGESRSFHLGIDIWKDAGTSVMAPLEGIIHSFQDNDDIGDYGPTIILKHKIEELEFYTLYGHLSRESIKGKHIGMKISKGQKFCNLGEWSVNVNWPPHLHFQIIKDLQGMSGDFPGVCTFSEKEKWMDNCPDPNLLLRLNGI